MAARQTILLALLAVVLAFMASSGLTSSASGVQLDRLADDIRLDAVRAEIRWSGTQAARYQRLRGGPPVTLAALNEALPEAAISAEDPWGRAWVVTAERGTLALCSRGPRGDWPCPSTRAAESLRASPLEQLPFGGFVVAALLVVTIPLYRLGRRAAGRGRAGSWSGWLWLVCVGVLAGTLLSGGMCCVASRALLASVRADRDRLTTAAERYAAHTGAPPPALTDLTSGASNARGEKAGPFVERLPDPRPWTYRYRRSDDGAFVITAEAARPR